MSMNGNSQMDGRANRSVESAYSYRAASPETLLWQAVLLTQVRDLFHIQVWEHPSRGQVTLKSKHCVDAENWIGRFPSQNFKTVCTLAGFEARAVHDRLIRIMALPDAERAQYSFSSMREDAANLWAKIKAHESGQQIKNGESDNA